MPCGRRYDWIEEITGRLFQIQAGQVLTTDRIDHILTRPCFLAFRFFSEFLVSFF